MVHNHYDVITNKDHPAPKLRLGESEPRKWVKYKHTRTYHNLKLNIISKEIHHFRSVPRFYVNKDTL